MKIAFFGTGDFSKNILSGIFKTKDIDISLVVSQPNKEIGREKIILDTPVINFAKENNLAFFQPLKIKDNIEFFSILKSLNLDFIIVVAYGKIIPKPILDIPKYGSINLHGSILPFYRGASPIQEAIKNGDKKTGLTIMYMSEGMDEGDILKIAEIDIDNLDKTQDIFRKFELIGPKLLLDVLYEIIDGNVKQKKQDNSIATYCSKISKLDGEINFSKQNSGDIFNKFRAYNIWPGIYTYYKGLKFNIEDCNLSYILEYEQNYLGELIVGKVVKINKKVIGILCADKRFIILNKVKLEGKKSLDILSFINGNKDFLNYIFE